jgi:hypothetical protein
LIALVVACGAGVAGVAGVAYAAGNPGVPLATSPPVITGTPVEGQTLVDGHAGWAGTPTSYAYQWEDCDGYGAACKAIPGAVAHTYTLAARDVSHTVRVEEKAANAAGFSGFATSAATGLVYLPGQQDKPPVSTAAPQINGASYVGGQLQASPGAWASMSRLTYAYQWQRCAPGCRAIARATKPSYTAASADQRARLRVLVTATNPFGHGQTTSALTAAVGPPNSAIHTPLVHAMTPTGKGARLSAVRSGHGYVFTFSAVLPGRLVVRWFYLPKGTHLGQAYGKVLPILVASATTLVRRSHRVRVKMTVSAAGRTQLAGKSVIKLAGQGSFSPSGRPSVTAVVRFTLTNALRSHSHAH